MTTTTLVATIAATLTTAAFLPQAVQTIKTKKVDGLSLGMYIVFSTGVLFWFIYGLIVMEWPIIIANLITFGFNITILRYVIKYRIK